MPKRPLLLVSLLLASLFSLIVACAVNTDPAATTDPQATAETEAMSGLFEAPIRIRSVEESQARMKSPAVYDVDGDGQVELIVGSLLGHHDVFENTNESSSGDPVWELQGKLKGIEGNTIRTPNW